MTLWISLEKVKALRIFPHEEMGDDLDDESDVDDKEEDQKEQSTYWICSVVLSNCEMIVFYSECALALYLCPKSEYNVVRMILHVIFAHTKYQS